MRKLALACCMAAAAAAQEAEVRVLLPQLGADDYDTREEAERRLEALVREGGHEAFDVLESKVLPEVRAGSEFEVALRVERVVHTRRLLWCTQLGQCLMWNPRVAVGDGVVVRTGPSGLDVLDARTGAALWSLTGAFEKPLPGIAGGLVYANRPPDAVAAYRAHDGRPVWAHELGDLGGDSGRTRNVSVHDKNGFRKGERPLPPAEWTDRYVMTLHVPEWNRTLVATHRGNIVALDAKGQRIWTANATGAVPRVCADLRLVFTAGQDDGARLVSLDADTGELRWGVPLEGLNGIAEKVSNGRLFVTAAPTVEDRIDGRLHAFDARTGKQLWTLKPPVPAVAAVDGPRTTETIRTRTETIRRGTISHPGDETRMWGAQVVAGGEIVITAVPALRFGLRASDGEILWKTKPQGIRLANAEKDGLVWGSSDRGEIVGVDPRDGSVVQRIDLMKLEAAADAPKLLVQRGDLPPAEELGDLSAPVFDGDACYVTTASGWTIALRIPPFRSRTGK